MEWITYTLTAVTLLGVVAAAILAWQKYRREGKGVLEATLLALQGGTERAIRALASAGHPELAHRVGMVVGDTIAEAGPRVKALNDVFHGTVKKALEAEHPAGKTTRDLIRDAFAKETRSTQPDA